MNDKKLSLVELLQHFFPERKVSKSLTSSKHRVMFILDGLDEYRLPLDFHSTLRCCDVTEPASVDVLLTNLIKKNLLPSALLWITTRPAAASQISLKYVDQVTEIRGFNDPQKEEYFRKKFSDENLALITITHLKSFRSLYIMCHIPIFCWILATVVERTSVELDKLEMPRTLTQMYTHFLIIQTSIKNVKYTERKETDEEIVFKLAKMAFQQLEKGNLIFYEEDLRECGIDVTEASVYSGVCTQIFREESGLYQGKVFSFVHLSIQEFLAAVYVFLCFRHRERGMSDQQQTSQLSALFRAVTLHDLHKTAVDLALESKNGHLDLFLRFLLGLSLESNQNLLMPLLPQTRRQPQSSEQIVQYIKQKIRDKDDYDRMINLFYCLNELNRHAVVEVIDRNSGTLSVDVLVPGQWKTRIFEFKIPEEQLDEFDLQKYIKTPETDETELLSADEVLQRLVPVVTSALLSSCSLTEKSCAVIASAASSKSCNLKELNLSDNELHDAGVQHLSELLKNPHCKLEKLELQYCSLTEKSCAVIVSAARSNSCCLKELNLSTNDLHDAGVQHLSELLKNPQCKLEKLELDGCSLTEKSCAVIASAARSNSCSLKELHLSDNELHDAGVQHLSELLKNPHCKLKKLALNSCSLTEKSCVAIASAARSKSCNLKELNLSDNELYDAGVQHLSEFLKNPHCKLETLELSSCSLTEKSCAVMASAARSNSYSLKELHLSYNDLHDAGVQHLSELLKNPHCKLETLKLSGCSLTEKSCVAIVSAARSNSCSLKELNLSDNELHDAGVQHLSELLKNPHCKLEKLELSGCFLTEKSCAAIASAARSISCSLKELYLSHNELHDAVQHLSELLKNPHCKLEKLQLCHCSITEKSCAAIASAASLNSCSLKDLNLMGNTLHDAGVQHLSELLKNPHCKLEKLEVNGRIFLKESPAAAASASSSQSDDAELYLNNKAQQNPGAQLISLDTGMEDHHNDAPQRSCESCAQVPDSSHWVLVKPEVSTEESVSTYSLSSPAGSYECPESGLRWTCAGSVTLQYHFTDWHVFAEELAHMQFGPAGPLMDIKLMSGELEEIHLPHFLCLGGSEAYVRDAVRVLHGRESGVCMEVFELTRHHARLVQPSFSLFGVVCHLRDLFSPKVHCELLLFCTCTAPLVLHTYLVPNDPAHIQAIHLAENRNGVRIRMSAVGPLWLNDSVHVRTSCPSEIHPTEMNLLPLSTGNFCEVVMEQPEEEFDMEVISSQHTEPIWRSKIRRRDYWQPSRIPGQGSSQETDTERLFQMRPGLISGVSSGVLRSMLDRLQAHRPPVLNGREAEEVLQRSQVLQDQVSCLVDMVHRKGDTACSTMLALLEELDPHLYGALIQMGLGRTFLEESPAAAAAASASSSHSDAEELHLRDQVQQDPGEQLPSLDTHTWTPTQVHEKFRSALKSKFQHLVEGVPNQGETRLLHEIYFTAEEGGLNDEHEITQIDRASRREAAQGKLMTCSNIFKPLLDDDRFNDPDISDEPDDISDESDNASHESDDTSDESDDTSDESDTSDQYDEASDESDHRQHKPIRTVLTKGVAGIGKTVCVQRLCLDWAGGQTHQDVDFIFPLPLRELNLMMDKQLSLMELIQHFFPEIKDYEIFASSKHKVMFIFDGLDECRLPLDFRSNLICSDVTEPASVDVLLTNLIKKNLLPTALLWITTRPAAANQIPPECVDRMTEIRGFSNSQKEEYFRMRISDKDLASRTITHLKSSRSLYIMCHIPVFCWTLATVVERASAVSDTLEMPRTLTQMYSHFLIIQTCLKAQKYRKETIFKLGKLAFQQLEKGNLIFYDEDLRECGIDVTEASVYSGVCTQIFREESGLYQGKVFSFAHLSIQEFLAALYVFLCFRNREEPQTSQSQLSVLFRAATLHELHKTAVDLTLQSENGHLDFFLRFLLGLSLESNQNLLKHLLTQTRSQPQNLEQTVQYIKQKIRALHNYYRINNLFCCLNELNHHAVVEVIDMSSGTLYVDMLMPGEWKAKRLMFKVPEKELVEFDLNKYIKTPETDQTELLCPDTILKRLVPVITSALLASHSLTKKSCVAIASAARSNSCNLKELDLSYNELHDAGVEHLSKLLKNSHCKLENLKLSGCFLTEKSCDMIASAARSNSCNLKKLNLSDNELHDEGVRHLSKLLKNRKCKLEKLELRGCSLTKKSCAAIESAVRSNSCSLKELDLSCNELHDAGVQHLSELLKNPHYKLEKLVLSGCSLTEISCSAIESAVRSESCSLKELYLSWNELHDTGVQHLSELLKNPHCKLEKLEVNGHTFLKESPAAASASRSHSDAAEPKVHGELLLFRVRADSLKLHAYLVPNEKQDHIQKIIQEEKQESVRIRKPAVFGPLWVEDSFCVRTSVQSKINPKEFKLLPLSTGKFFEVYLNDAEKEFDIHVISSQSKDPIWTVKIYNSDYGQLSRNPEQGSGQGANTVSTTSTEEMPSGSSSPVQPASGSSSITAHTGGVVVAPSLSGNTFNGPVHMLLNADQTPPK
ncbi:uncharacterized protein LOC134070012 isoform X2 [Sardina pilchardus]|uniref:uncharacterized protein LOC134070012 isoform X2 n=1 Tax=Sardina pilchardus TaxID=27697 RepID=UPI002E0D8641